MNKQLGFFIACLFLISHTKSCFSSHINETEMSMKEMSKAYGYGIESFEIITKDGYILNLFHLYNKTNLRTDAYPMFLIHGLLGCANNWILLARNSLPYLLADKGYDVWLPNARGTVHSLKHKNLSSQDSRYWKFSWHEIGVFDMTASIDFTLNATGHSKVFVIAHSEGCTDFFAMAADLPEYDKKVEMSIHMAPPVFCTDMSFEFAKGLINILHDWKIENIMKILELNNFVPNFYTISKFMVEFCESKSFENVCNGLVKLLFEDGTQINSTLISYYFSKVPCGGGVREFFHYLQNCHAGSFDHFSFGSKGNLKRYNSTKPPPYNLSNIKSKVALFYGPGDRYSKKNDVEKLARALPNVVFLEGANNTHWTHMDFLLGIDVFEIAYKKVLYLIDHYNHIFN